MSPSDPMDITSGSEGEIVFGDLRTTDFAPPMKRLVNALLLYKSMFVGPWFAALAREEDPETSAAYLRISKDTARQARQATELIRQWGNHPQHETVEDVTKQVLTRLLQDMLELKKNSTEVFLAAGIRSPTEELRRQFLDLARMDREHADTLRELLGIRIPEKDRRAHADPPAIGPQVGPFEAGTLSGRLQKALEDAREHGHDPSRLILSSECLRHLRDEGVVMPHRGEIFGVPVDIDFSWTGEAFAVTSKERLSLAEIVTEANPGEPERER